MNAIKRFKQWIHRTFRLYRRGHIKVVNQDWVWMCMHGYGKSKTPPFLSFRIGQNIFWYDSYNRHFYLDVSFGDVHPEDIKAASTVNPN